MISLIDTANMLNSLRTISEVCTSNNINQWSFYKPINSTKIGQLTDNDIYAANDGFNLYTISNPSRLVYELQNPNIYDLWSYEDRTAPFRLSDFEGYYHTGGMDFSLSWVNNSSGQIGDLLRLDYNFDIQQLINNWAYFSGVRISGMTSGDIMLLIYEQGTSFQVNTPVWVYKVMQFIDYDDRINFTIPSVLSQGTYEIRLCFSTGTNLSNGECVRYNENSTLYATWYAMPHNCVTTFTVATTPGPGPGPTPTDFFDWVDFDTFTHCSFDYYEPDLLNVNITHLISLLDTTKDIRIYIQYSYENRVQGTMDWGTYSFNLNGNNTSHTLQIIQQGPIETMTEAHLPDDIIAVKIYAKITDNTNNVTQYKQWIQNIEKS